MCMSTRLILVVFAFSWLAYSTRWRPNTARTSAKRCTGHHISLSANILPLRSLVPSNNQLAPTIQTKIWRNTFADSPQTTLHYLAGLVSKRFNWNAYLSMSASKLLLLNSNTMTTAPVGEQYLLFAHVPQPIHYFQILGSRYTPRTTLIYHITGSTCCSWYSTSRRAMPSQWRYWLRSCSHPMRRCQPGYACRSRPPQQNQLGLTGRLVWSSPTLRFVRSNRLQTDIHNSKGASQFHLIQIFGILY